MQTQGHVLGHPGLDPASRLVDARRGAVELVVDGGQELLEAAELGLEGGQPRVHVRFAHRVLREPGPLMRPPAGEYASQ
ncbi:MAG: hypothetical protein DME00_22135 [Candidatus Rokuibacteriota bacterium]|nr:MAG: hypothetical protein DME00_22135 [Candidatus Rokubacteria bacterium]PYO09893.1 MAG: hypothetical protein DMD75_14580 [Candidatus Rokubacteria bacterium]